MHIQRWAVAPWLPVLFVFACAKSPLKVIQDYEAACNRHDITKALSLIADDVRFAFANETAIRTKPQWRRIMESDSVLNDRVDYFDFRVSGDTVSFLMNESSDLLRALNLMALPPDTVGMIVRGGRIVEVNIALAAEAEGVYTSRMNEVMAWAMQNRPEMMIDAQQGDLFNKQSAPKWLALARAWQEAGGR